MDLRIVGAGVGRTGTHSLKVALEQLLGGPCYHMREVFEHQDHVPIWHAAMHGDTVDWEPVFEGFVATVDWPGCTFWREFASANPKAKVLLSHRDSADTWWKSASNTIFRAMGDGTRMEANQWLEMARKMMERFSPDWQQEAAAKAAYDAHNAAVRAEVPKDRLIDWQPSDGWGPLCAGLDIPEPDEPFPVTNTTEEFQKMMGGS